MANLVETILSALPADIGDSLATAHGEQPDNIVKGLSAILPLLLASFAGKAATGVDMAGISSMLQGGFAGANPLDAPESLVNPAASAGGLGGLAGQLLGSNMTPIVAAVASYFGLKSGTVQQLMALGGPLIAGGLGKVLGSAPSMDSIRRLLASEKGSYEQALPTELRQLVAPVQTAPVVPPPAPATEAGGQGKLLWILLGLAVAALLAWLIFGRGEKPDVAVPAPDSAVVETMAVVPDGAGVVTEERSGLPVLMVFFATGASEVSADLAPSSADVKAYLDSNPAARLSVSGYNDPTGNAAANAALSLSRAERVRDALVAAGIAPERIDLDKPAETTDSSDSMAAARRVEVTVKP